MNKKNPAETQLSLCMIVKNEEKNLSSCLESVKDIVDEMIILDTGSDDNTVRIAEEYGAEVHHFKWCDDFSRARNESIKYAKGKWILWMDADERLNSNSKDELRSILETSHRPLGVNVTIKNISRNQIRYGNAYRMFSNYFGIQFRNIVHEQISYSLKEMKAEILDSNIIIDHFGYDADKFDQEEKRKRNLPLLHRMIEDSPKDFFPQFLLGQHYSGEKNNQDKAIYHLTNFLNLNSGETQLIASAYTTLADIYLSKNDLDNAKTQVERSLESAPNQFVAHYQFAKIGFAQKQYQIAIDYLEKLSRKIDRAKTPKSENALDSVFSINHIKGFSIKINMFNLNRELSLKLIIDLWRACDGYDEMKQIFYEWDDIERDKLISLIKNSEFTGPDLNVLYEICGFLYLLKSDYENALPIFQNLVDNNHKNTYIIKTLAGIYAKMGRMDRASELLTSIT